MSEMARTRTNAYFSYGENPHGLIRAAYAIRLLSAVDYPHELNAHTAVVSHVSEFPGCRRLCAAREPAT